jgi:hypothetical protein
MSRRATTVALAIVLVAAGWVGATPVGATTIQVANETQYRQALTTLSAAGGGPHRIDVTASFTLTGGTDPTYTGPADLMIAGGGHTISGGGNVRILHSTGTADLVIRDLVLRQGAAAGDDEDGGAVLTEQSVTLQRVTLRDNLAGRWGGGVRADDILATDIVATGNSAGLAGAVFVAVDLEVRGGWVTSNEGHGVLSGEGSRIQGVYAADNLGGAVVNSPGVSGRGFVTDSTFADNEGVAVSFDISGVTIRDSRFERNRGGGVNAGDGELTIERSTFVRNGGASFFGGAFGNGTVVRDSSFIRNESTGQGGGVQAGDDGLEVTNSTFVGNRAPVGAAISAFDASLRFVTVDGNISPGSSVETHHLDALATAIGATEGGGIGCDVDQPVTSRGSNVDGGSSCGFVGAGDQSDVGEPRLGAPRDNGSGRPTAFPLRHSPVLDGVPVGQCSPGTDGRGAVRPFGPACEAGAVEAVFPAHGYRDVPPWLEAAARWITSDANHPVILPGGTGGRFRPNTAMTRGVAAQMLYDAAGAPGRFSAGSCSLSHGDDAHSDAICWVNASGIVDGYSDGTFRPQLQVTRAQLVQWLHSLAGSVTPPAQPDHRFVDVRPGADLAVRWAVQNELVTGYAGHRFRPAASVSRGQAARMLWYLVGTPEAWAEPAAAVPSALFVEG